MSQNKPQSRLPVVHIFTTGGTIASRIDPATGAATPVLKAQELLSQIPSLAEVAEIRTTEFSLVSSWNMTPRMVTKLSSEVAAVLSDDEVSGVVITHGTDTMEETAFMLDIQIDSEKPVVITGAMRNASQTGADGPRNLLAAVRVAVEPSARETGVLVVMNDEIHAARFVTKTHTTALDTFKSPDAGPLGSVDEKGVWLHWRPSPHNKLPASVPEPKVYLVKMAVGMDDLLLRSVLEAGARGVVIEGSGAGNVPEGWEGSITSLLRENIPVVLVSRCPGGRVVPAYGGGGGGRTLHNIGVIDGGWLSGPKARIALMLALGCGMDLKGVREYFAQLTR